MIHLRLLLLILICGNFALAKPKPIRTVAGFTSLACGTLLLITSFLSKNAAEGAEASTFRFDELASREVNTRTKTELEEQRDQEQIRASNYYGLAAVSMLGGLVAVMPGAYLMSQVSKQTGRNVSRGYANPLRLYDIPSHVRLFVDGLEIEPVNGEVVIFRPLLQRTHLHVAEYGKVREVRIPPVSHSVFEIEYRLDYAHLQEASEQ